MTTAQRQHIVHFDTAAVMGGIYGDGIIALKGDDERYVLQGVHMIIEGDHQRAWKDGEKHESRLVFIGRDLDAARHAARRLETLGLGRVRVVTSGP